MLSLRIQRLGDATVFRCVGRITISDVGVLRIAALRQPGIRTLVLDLAEIIAVDAAGLGILVSLRAWAKESGVVLKLMNLTPRVQDLLELTNLKSAFQICSAREMLTLLCRAINDTQSTRFEAPIHDPDGVNEIMAETFFQPTKRPSCSTSYMRRVHGYGTEPGSFASMVISPRASNASYDLYLHRSALRLIEIL